MIPPGQYSKQAPPLTGAAKAATDAKQAKAMAYFQAAQRAWSRQNSADAPSSLAAAASPPIHKTLNVPLQLQQDPDWCGPATMAMIVKYRGHGYPGSLTTQQQAAANALGTNNSGTDYGAMQPALNSRIGQFFYVNTPLPGSPSSSDINVYEAELVNDVNIGTGWPLAANEYALPAYWLVNQHQNPSPTNPYNIIMHWIVADGYGGSGAETHYDDPGWGNTSVAYYKEQSPYFVTALGGRGYVF